VSTADPIHIHNPVQAETKKEEETTMKRLLTTMSVVAALMLALAPAAIAGPGGGKGYSSDQLANAGWFCDILGPNNWTHCFSPGKKSASAKATNVKIFSEDGSTFLGTEILLSADVYNGQPCTTDDGEPYSYVPPLNAYACHHFQTGN
jgi:hypothetical protein